MTLPASVANLLIDVSDAQTQVDYAAAKAAGVEAVFIKATEGATFVASQFGTHYEAATAAGLRVGAYHFGTAATVADQVSNFVNTVTARAPGFKGVVVALDVEHNDPHPSNTMTPDLAESWVTTFKAQTGLTPLIYAGDYLRGLGGANGRSAMASCPLWVASYTTSPIALPGWNAWTLWQFTDGSHGPYAGKVAGVGACDQDGYNATAPQSLVDFWTSRAGG